MKKIIVILIAILVVAYIGLYAVSRDREHAAEKLYFKATKSYGKIRENPEVAPPAMLLSVRARLDEIIRRYPKTNVAKQARLNMAELYW